MIGPEGTSHRNIAELHKIKGDVSKITRLTIIDHRNSGLGILMEEWGVKVELVVQDNGKTLKVFMLDRSYEEE